MTNENELEALARGLQDAAAGVDKAMNDLHAGIAAMMEAFGDLSRYVAADAAQTKLENERLTAKLEQAVGA